MEYNKEICAVRPGDEIEGFYILKTAASKVTSSGKPFLTATLSDATGMIEAKVWDYTGPVGGADEGKVVKIRGSVTEFRGSAQVTVDKIRLADANDHYNVACLVPVAPIDEETVFADITGLLHSIADPDYRQIALELLKRHEAALRKIPAAKSVHHGFLGGLLMHTGNMLRLADFLAGVYADTVDRDLLLAGTFAHDLQKESEFAFSELGLVTDYSVSGQLLGHLVMGAQEVAGIAEELGIPEEKSVLLQHMVLSHHGEPEFGAAVRPMCAESELLSYIDSIDSRMEIYREAFDKMQVGEFSPRIFALEKRVYRHARSGDGGRGEE